jgi:hypothetical protein
MNVDIVFYKSNLILIKNFDTSVDIVFNQSSLTEKFWLLKKRYVHFWGDGGGVTHHPARQQAMTIHNVSEIAEHSE